MEMHAIIEVLKTKLDLLPIPKGFKCKCFMHNDLDGESMVIVLENYSFHCFGCGKGGSIDELLELLEIDT